MPYTQQLIKKWSPLIGAAQTIQQQRLSAIMLENCLTGNDGFQKKKTIREHLLSEAPVTGVGPQGVGPNIAPDGSTSGNLGDGRAISGYDALMASVITRMVPTLIALDIVGVQPMRGPTGMIFATRWEDEDGKEYLDPRSPLPADALTPVDPEVGEVSNANPSGGGAWKDVILRISRETAEAKTFLHRIRGTHEVFDDLNNLHQIDVEELGQSVANVAAHMINQKILHAIDSAQIDTTTSFAVDFTDANFHKLFYYIKYLALSIAQDTGRSSGNFVVTSRRVAAYMWSWMHDHGYRESVHGSLDSLGNSTSHAFVGAFQGLRIFVDHSIPDSDPDQIIVGARGSSHFDSGLFFCPYTLCDKLVTATDSNTMQPLLGSRSRYAIVGNPHAKGFNNTTAQVLNGGNVFYRKFSVTGLDAIMT